MFEKPLDNAPEGPEKKKWGVAKKIETIEGGVEGVWKAFGEAEAFFQAGNKDAFKLLLGKIYATLIELNKSGSEPIYELAKWNPSGDLTEEEFNKFDSHRKKLSEIMRLVAIAAGEAEPEENKEVDLEKSNEVIPTKEEVLEIISRKTESSAEVTVLREISDEKGLRVLDIRVAGEKGETTEYLYSRKGMFPNNKNIQIETKTTTIEATYFQDGDVVSAGHVAVFNYETGQWEVEE